MTVSTSVNKFRYQGNEVTDTFSFTGRIFNEADLVIEIIDRATDILLETLVLTTDYTVTINSDESASVTVDADKIPSNAEDIQLRRALPLTQTVDLPTGTVFPARIVESALDRATATVQDLSEQVGRSIKLSPTTSFSGELDFPEPLAGAAIIWNDTGDNLTTTSTSIAILEGNAAIVAANIGSVNTVAGSIANVNSVSGAITNINTVAGSVANVNTVAANIANINSVEANETNINIVAADLSGADTIGTVAAAISDVMVASSNITAVQAVSSNATDISLVADNVADINTAADNMAAIIAAPLAAQDAEDAAALAESWAIDPIGDRPEGSAKYWAEQAAATAVGNGAALSILGRSANSTGARADIVFSSNNTVLKRKGNALVTEAVEFADIDNNAIASQAEAEAGTATTKLMTPQRVAQAMDALRPFATSGFIPSLEAKDYTITQYAPFAGTITKVVTQSTAGTATFTVKINGVALGGTANSVSSSEQERDHTASNTFAIGDKITFTASSVSSAVNVGFSVIGERA